MKKKFIVLLLLLLGLTILLCACAHKHKLVQIEMTEATCTTDGNIEYWQCTGCKKKFTDNTGMKQITDVVIPAGHKLSKITANSATCTTDGNVGYWQCGGCGKKFADGSGTEEITDVVIPAGHKLTEVTANSATCTTDGNVGYWQCGGCGKKFADGSGAREITDVIIPANHKYGEYDYDYETKSYSRSCSACGDVQSVDAGSADFPILARNETELAESVSSAAARSFIKLANDITVSTGMYEVVLRLPDNGVLDLGGHTVTVKNNGGFVVEGTDVTLQNGKVVTDYAVPNSGYAVFIGDEGDNNSVTVRHLDTKGGLNVYNCKATLYDCNVDASSHTYYALWADAHSEITAVSGVYRGGETACIHSTVDADPEGTDYIVINGGEYYGKIIATFGTVINGGSFDGDIVLTDYNNVTAKLTVNKDIDSSLNIVVGDAAKYDIVCSQDDEGNFVYETALKQQTN